MHNKKYLRYLLSMLAPLLFMIGVQIPVHAASYNVPLQVLENGSSNTSYAAAYFANSATVTPNGNGSYTVTSTVTTQKDLGNYPVQVLSIDGAGANVSRSDSGNSQTITYSFVTSNLSARHNAAIKVDVNSINYHHNYVVGLSLNASSVPAATSSSSSSATSQLSSSSSQVASSQTTSSSVVASSSSSSESSQSSSTTTSSNATSKHAASKSSQKSTKQVAEETHKDKQLPVAAIVGGGLAIGVILGLVINLKKK